MVVLAGGIGSGKSVVARILRINGFGVFDCDYEAARMMNEDPEIVDCVRFHAGEDIYDASGRLDRRRLASVFFEDKDLRKEINKMVHAAVRKRIGEWLEESKTNVFVESAIAAQSGLVEMADVIWIVRASEKCRLERVAERDKRSKDEIRKIILVQEEEEKRLADSGVRIVWIDNDDSTALLQKVKSLICEIELTD